MKTRVIKGCKRLVSAKTRFYMGFCDSVDSMRSAESENIKAFIAEIADSVNGFSITTYLNDGRKMRYIGFVYGDEWRVAYFYDGIPYGHFDGNMIENFLEEIVNHIENGHDLYIKEV